MTHDACVNRIWIEFHSPKFTFGLTRAYLKFIDHLKYESQISEIFIYISGINLPDFTQSHLVMQNARE